MIQVEMIEANEFYEMAMHYNVSGVPKTIINDDAGEIMGAVPEDVMLQELMKTVELLTSP